MSRLPAAVAAGAALSRTLLPIGGTVLERVAPAAADGLRRTNFRGHQVSLIGGPVLCASATAAAVVGALRSGDASATNIAAAAAVAGLGSGLVGGYDDIVGARPEQRAAKGFRGHLAALRAGRVTSGLVKVAGVGAAGLAAAVIVDGGPRRRGVVDTLLSAGVIAGTANLLNLLDLRPGRALKAGVIIAAPLTAGGWASGGRAAGASGGRTAGASVAAGALGAALGLLPADLDEQIMVGDAGANALGALLGTAAAARTGRWGRAALLTGIVALTAASERVSFTSVIARTPVLRELDALGRRAG
jgi:UDP-N-acetylmuramyl pentapeptide phosphotransferase/UDP-N-acetylglucosamine-1-phosphate transferase